MTQTIRGKCGPAAKLDIEYGRGMDVLTSGGFAYMPENRQFQNDTCHACHIFSNVISEIPFSFGQTSELLIETDKDASCINTSWGQ